MSAPARAKFVGGPGADADDERKTTVAGGSHSGVGVVHYDTPLRPHAESAGDFQKDCRVGSLDRSAITGDSVDADAEQVVDPGRFQCLLTLRA